MQHGVEASKSLVTAPALIARSTRARLSARRATRTRGRIHGCVWCWLRQRAFKLLESIRVNSRDLAPLGSWWLCGRSLGRTCTSALSARASWDLLIRSRHFTISRGRSRLCTRGITATPSGPTWPGWNIIRRLQSAMLHIGAGCRVSWVSTYTIAAWASWKVIMARRWLVEAGGATIIGESLWAIGQIGSWGRRTARWIGPSVILVGPSWFATTGTAARPVRVLRHELSASGRLRAMEGIGGTHASSAIHWPLWFSWQATLTVWWAAHWIVR